MLVSPRLECIGVMMPHLLLPEVQSTRLPTDAQDQIPRLLFLSPRKSLTNTHIPLKVHL